MPRPSRSRLQALAPPRRGPRLPPPVPRVPRLGFFRNTSGGCIIGGGRYRRYGTIDHPSAVARFVPTSSCLAGDSWRDWHRKPFAVVFMVIIRTATLYFVYSSETGRWSEPAEHCAPQPGDQLKLEPNVLVGNVLYFMLQTRTKILQYDISTRKMGVIQLPTVCFSERRIVLMAMEDGGLGFAIVRDSKLLLWSMEVGSDGDAGWAQRGVIDLKKLLPSGAFSSRLPDVVGFADGIDVFFLQTNDGVVTIDLIDLKSTRVARVPKISGGSTIFPYMSFYSPALGASAASTGGEGPSTGASGVSKA